MEHVEPTHRAAAARRPPDAGIDLDPARRPGVPKERAPKPWPNTRYPPARMRAEPSVPMHGRPNKPMPPVYGTAVPPAGLSGALRRSAYARPDHVASHWLMLLFADRVDSWGTRARKLLPIAAPLALLVYARRRRDRGRDHRRLSEAFG
jgi:hypothetical protein